MYGYSAAEAIGQSSTMLVPADRVAERLDTFKKLEQGQPVKHVDTVRLRRNGQPLDVSSSMTSILDSQGETVAYAAITYDITERRSIREKLKYQALHDPLTHLPNRTLLQDRLEQAIFSAHRGAASMALLHFDLDRFKEVNDTSARNLHDPHLADSISWLVRNAGVDASSLIVEITEGSLISDPDQALVILSTLHDMGIKISIDDFGTGYSSLAYLKQLPVDEIKIDRSFILSMNRNGTVIVRSVIDLARNLGLIVTADGMVQ